MKKNILAGITILLTIHSAGYASLMQVNLISQYHVVEGYVYGEPNPATYDAEDSSPVSGSTSSPFGTASSNAGNLTVYGSTSGGDTSYWAEAKSWYVFYPYTTTLDFAISESCSWSGGPWGSSFSYYLKDLEDDSILSQFTGDGNFIFSQREDDNTFSDWQYQEQFSVLTDHRYELYLFIHADAMDGTTVSMTADIPEPASLLLLVGGMLFRKLKN